jgi:hypothetical protein
VITRYDRNGFYILAREFIFMLPGGLMLARRLGWNGGLSHLMEAAAALILPEAKI